MGASESCRSRASSRAASCPRQPARGRLAAVGERFGLIRFGSRVDVYLPEGVKPLVGVGQKALAGETIIADASTKDRGWTWKVG